MSALSSPALSSRGCLSQIGNNTSTHEKYALPSEACGPIDFLRSLAETQHRIADAKAALASFDDSCGLEPEAEVEGPSMDEFLAEEATEQKACVDWERRYHAKERDPGMETMEKWLLAHPDELRVLDTENSEALRDTDATKRRATRTIDLVEEETTSKVEVEPSPIAASSPDLCRTASEAKPDAKAMLLQLLMGGGAPQKLAQAPERKSRVPDRRQWRWEEAAICCNGCHSPVKGDVHMMDGRSFCEACRPKGFQRHSADNRRMRRNCRRQRSG